MNEQNPPDASPKKATLPSVPLVEWKSLYELASRVRQDEPWRTLTETDLFALEDPVTKQVGLVSVLGCFGEVYAVELYLPPEGLLYWLQFFFKGEPDPTLNDFELRMLEATFVSKKELEQPDLVVLDQLDLGRPKKRLKGYAQFRSYRPGCVAWYLDAEEVRLMRLALGASMEFAARRIRRQEPWLLVDSTVSGLPVLSVYSPVAEPPGWSVRRERIQVEENSFVPPPITEILDEVTRRRLPELSVKHGAWQTGACYLPVPAISEGRLVYPVAALVGDESDAELLEASLTADLKIRSPSAIVRAVATAAIKRDGFPQIIKVARSEERNALESLREFCPGLEVILDKKLDSLDFLISELDAAMARADLTDPRVALKVLEALPVKRGSEKISNQVFKTTTYRLKITLRHSDPSIWRRLEVRGDILLGDLHQLFQIGMGWYDEHLHEFRVGSNGYSDPAASGSANDENATTLGQIAPRKGSRFVYTYDFGDSWDHDVLVENVERGTVPVAPCCFAGQNACPPEDSGGVFGYTRLLESLADPSHPNHEESKQWVSEDFDPTYFNAEEVNAEFARLAED